MSDAATAPGPFVFILLASVSSFACGSTQAVMDAGGCADPCCNGISAHIDCAEHPTLNCVEKGDPCTANQYGCNKGEFFSRAPSPLPASCAQADASAHD